MYVQHILILFLTPDKISVASNTVNNHVQIRFWILEMRNLKLY